MGYRDYRPILDQGTQVVNDDMNESLIKLVSREEIKKAVFKMEARKP